MKKDFRATAPGKIILTGEYAVVFGRRGIAIPSKESLTVTWTEDASLAGPVIDWEEGVDPTWIDYTLRIFGYLEPLTGPLKGTLRVLCGLPLGKGMGSSTSLVIAVCRCFLGPECEKAARMVEDRINPGHSGIDFAVIFKNAPILYARGKEPEIPEIPNNILKGARLIDSGKPNETTKELVAWMKTREAEIAPAIQAIGDCTERLLKGETLHSVIRDHHRAQVMLGIVPESALKIIEGIENEGGSAKVIGAGGRTGGGGMVLVLPAMA